MSTKTVEDSSFGIRESMLQLPGIIQPVLTWITGKPPVGAVAKFYLTPFLHLLTALLALFGGATISILLSLSSLPIWVTLIFLVTSWIVTVSGARKLLIMIGHQCVHGKFSGNEKLDRVIMEVVSTIILVQDYEGYKKDHVSIHHSKVLATLEDPDVKFMVALGILPGLDKGSLWRRFWQTNVSPKYHFDFLRARVKVNFMTPPLYRRVMSFLWLSFTIFLVIVTGGWLQYVIGWVIPIIFLYHISALMQFTSEHKWLQKRDPKAPGRLVLARLTSGRFLGEAVPASSVFTVEGAAKWGQWLFRLLFIHLPARVFVLMGDLPQHDYHHRKPSSEWWVNAAYARQRDLEEGCPGWPEVYTEVWGLGNAIDQVFECMSNLPPLDEYGQEISRVELNEVLNGM